MSTLDSMFFPSFKWMDNIDIVKDLPSIEKRKSLSSGRLLGIYYSVFRLAINLKINCYEIRVWFKKIGIVLDYPMCNLPDFLGSLPEEYGEELYAKVSVMTKRLSGILEEIKEIDSFLAKSDLPRSRSFLKWAMVDLSDLLDALKDVLLAIEMKFGPDKEEIRAMDEEIRKLLAV